MIIKTEMTSFSFYTHTQKRFFLFYDFTKRTNTQAIIIHRHLQTRNRYKDDDTWVMSTFPATYPFKMTYVHKIQKSKSTPIPHTHTQKSCQNMNVILLLVKQQTHDLFISKENPLISELLWNSGHDCSKVKLQLIVKM